MIQHLGRYQILRELGRGGMGVVYKALDPNLERHVAIKCLNEELSRDELVVARFLREARNVAALTHPNCVRLYVADEQDGMPYFVMEYVDGQSLADYLAKHGRCAPDMALRVVRQCAEALAAADAKNIVHRDVKPGNVMLDSSGRALLADFGIACVQYGSNTGGSLTIMGTPGYMPPELVERGQSDRRSDIFALGAVYYEMLTGKRLLSGGDLASLRSKMRQPGFPDLTAIEAEHGAKTAALLARMLAPEPDARFADYAELIEALDPDHAALSRRAAETAPTMQVSTLTGSDAAEVAPTLAATKTANVEDAAATRLMPAPGMARYRKAGLAALLVAGITLIGFAIALTGSGDSDPPTVAASVDDAAATIEPSNRGPAAWLDDVAANSDTTVAASEPLASPSIPASESPSETTSEQPPRAPVAMSETSPNEFVTAAVSRDAASATTASTSAGFAFELSKPESQSGTETLDSDSPVGLATTTQIPSEYQPIELAGVDPRVAATPIAAAETGSASVPRRAAATVERTAVPAASRIAVVAVGDPTIARPMASEVESALRQDGRAVAERRFIAGFDQYLYEDGLDLAGLAEPAARAGVRYVVMVRAIPTGSRELYYYGRYDTAFAVQVDAVTYDLLRADQVGSSSVESLEYTSLNAGQKARDAVAPWLEPIRRQFGR